MFERTKVDNSQALVGVPVEITQDSGQVDNGRLLIAVSTRVVDVLNGPLQYLEFEDYQGQRTLICKTGVRALRVVDVPAQILKLAVLRQNPRISGADRTRALEPGLG